jgi:hypothetical protein
MSAWRTTIIRSWGLPVLAIFAVIEYINARDRTLDMIAYAPSVMDSADGALILINPLLAGLVCAETLSVARGARWEIVTALRDGGGRLIATRVLATAGWVALLHAAIVAGLLADSITTTSSRVPTLLPLIPAILSLFTYGALGAVTGRLWPSWIAPPLLVFLLYVVAVLVQRSLPDPLVRFSGSTNLLLGLAFRRDVIAAQVLWLIVIGAACIAVAIVPVRGYQDRRLTVGAALIAVILAGSLLGSRGDLRFYTARPAFVCEGNSPQVCVVADYADQLHPEYLSVSQAVHLVQRLGGGDLPGRFEQGTADSQFEGGSIGHFTIYHLDADKGLTAEVAFENLIFQVTESVSCPRRVPSFDEIRNVVQWASYLHYGTPPPPGVPSSRLEPRARTAMKVLTTCD